MSRGGLLALLSDTDVAWKWGQSSNSGNTSSLGIQWGAVTSSFLPDWQSQVLHVCICTSMWMSQFISRPISSSSTPSSPMRLSLHAGCREDSGAYVGVFNSPPVDKAVMLFGNKMFGKHIAQSSCRAQWETLYQEKSSNRRFIQVENLLLPCQLWRLGEKGLQINNSSY